MSGLWEYRAICLTGKREICFRNIEFVAPDDTMFKRLTRGNDHLYDYLSKDLFEDCCSKYFQIMDTQHLDGTQRWLYALRKMNLNTKTGLSP